MGSEESNPAAAAGGTRRQSPFTAAYFGGLGERRTHRAADGSGADAQMPQELPPGRIMDAYNSDAGIPF